MSLFKLWPSICTPVSVTPLHHLFRHQERMSKYFKGHQAQMETIEVWKGIESLAQPFNCYISNSAAPIKKSRSEQLFIVHYMKLTSSSFKEVKAWMAWPRYWTPEPVIFSHILSRNTEKSLVKVLLECQTDSFQRNESPYSLSNPLYCDVSDTRATIQGIRKKCFLR